MKMDQVVNKLNQVAVSAKMSAVVDFLLDHNHCYLQKASPVISNLYGTSDGYVLIEFEGECGANEFLGTKQNLFENVIGLAACAELTQEETTWLLGMIPIDCRKDG